MEYLVASGYWVGPTARHCPVPKAGSHLPDPPDQGSGHRKPLQPRPALGPGDRSSCPHRAGVPSSRQEVPTGLRSALLGSRLAVFQKRVPEAAPLSQLLIFIKR